MEWASLQPSNNEGADFVYFKYPDQKVYNGDKSTKVEVLCEKVWVSYGSSFLLWFYN